MERPWKETLKKKQQTQGDIFALCFCPKKLEAGQSLLECPAITQGRGKSDSLVNRNRGTTCKLPLKTTSGLYFKVFKNRQTSRDTLLVFQL